MQKDSNGGQDRDQLLTRPDSKVEPYIEAMARRPVGPCEIMITHMRLIEKMHLLQINLGRSKKSDTHPK